MNHDFSELHPHMASRERGWHPVPNPLASQPPRRAYGHSVKHIFLQADQLLYDVDAITGMIDRTARIAHNDTKVATSESDTYRPMFFRWFDKYIASVEHCLSAFVLKPEGVTRLNDLKEWDEREISLLMPDYWDATVYDSLVQAIHQYVVDGALYEYLSITFSSRDPRTIDRKQSLEEDITNIRALSCRVIPGTVHKHLKPF
ncbi:hypothetical protein [uncultured Prevotella sp.]|uniref:hypothetical protein n=1 Tax=uncultured Prevotella sp. TaxID=159272 RepID=UPI0026305BB9|nr:hypothetical protein [uncultured Prevotella sp.]